MKNKSLKDILSFYQGDNMEGVQAIKERKSNEEIINSFKREIEELYNIIDTLKSIVVTEKEKNVELQNKISRYDSMIKNGVLR